MGSWAAFKVDELQQRIRELESAIKSRDLANIILQEENERLKEGKDLLAKQLAYYRRDNEKLNNALAWEHNESDNAKDAERWRKVINNQVEGVAICKEGSYGVPWVAIGQNEATHRVDGGQG